jgi:hypothetical protein
LIEAREVINFILKGLSLTYSIHASTQVAMGKIIEASQIVMMSSRQEGEPRGIDHIIETSRIRKKSIQTAPKDSANWNCF